jgi:hypothetical protein
LIFTASDDTNSIQKNVTLVFKSKPALTKVYKPAYDAPKVKSMEVSNNGRITITFNQNMQFDDALIEKLNEGKGNFLVTYLSGYRPESVEINKNSLTKYKVVEAKQDTVKV